MTRRYVDLGRDWVRELSDPDRQAWFTWLHRHGLDEHKVILDGLLCIDDARCEIIYTSIRPAEHGPILGRRGIHYELFKARVQLEAPALPCPPGLLVEVEP